MVSDAIECMQEEEEWQEVIAQSNSWQHAAVQDVPAAGDTAAEPDAAMSNTDPALDAAVEADAEFPTPDAAAVAADEATGPLPDKRNPNPSKAVCDCWRS